MQRHHHAEHQRDAEPTADHVFARRDTGAADDGHDAECVVLVHRVAEGRAYEEHVEEREDHDVAERQVELAVHEGAVAAGLASAGTDGDASGGESPR